MGFCNLFEKMWQYKPELESEESKEKRFESIFAYAEVNNGHLIYSSDDREGLEKFLLKKGYKFKDKHIKEEKKVSNEELLKMGFESEISLQQSREKTAALAEQLAWDKRFREAARQRQKNIRDRIKNPQSIWGKRRGRK